MGDGDQLSIIVLRAPSIHTFKSRADRSDNQNSAETVTAPTFEWLSGTWNVTYSSLPLWKGKKNVRITYGKSDVQNAQKPDQLPPLDDHVEYQKIGQKKISHVRGISKPVDLVGVDHGLAFSWRGKGLLMIATSDWEILGWGLDDQDDPASQWVVTYFGKTLFTPAGIDIYSRSIHGVSSSTVAKIKEELSALLGGELSGISDALFEIPQE